MLSEFRLQFADIWRKTQPPATALLDKTVCPICPYSGTPMMRYIWKMWAAVERWEEVRWKPVGSEIQVQYISDQYSAFLVNTTCHSYYKSAGRRYTCKNHLKFWTSRDHSDDIRYKIHPQISKCEMSAQPSLPKFAKFMLTFCSAKCWPSQIFTPCCDFASSHNRVGSRFRPSVFYIR